MSHARNRLRTLGLGLIAVLGLAAMMAGGAQAASWLVPGGTTLSGHANVDANIHSGVLGLFLVPTLIKGGFAIDCQALSVTQGLLFGSSLTEPGVGHGVIHFTQCLAYVAGGHEEPCDPVNKLVEAKALVTPITHEGVTKLLFTPPTGSTQFALINIGGECALPVKNKVTGKLLASCLTGLTTLLDCLHAQNVVPLRQLTALEHALKYGNHAATLDGVVDVLNIGGSSLGAHG